MCHKTQHCQWNFACASNVPIHLFLKMLWEKKIMVWIKKFAQLTPDYLFKCEYYFSKERIKISWPGRQIILQATQLQILYAHKIIHETDWQHISNRIKPFLKETNMEETTQLQIPLTLSHGLLRSKGNRVYGVWQINGMKEDFQ